MKTLTIIYLAATAAAFAYVGGRLLLQAARPCGRNAGADHRGHWAGPDRVDGGDGMKAAYTRIKKPRRVTDDPVIYVCSPYAADPERNARRAENFCRYVWKMGGIPLAPHLPFPRFMNENRHKEREAGLRMARKLLGMCDEMWVFGDEISEGMVGEIIEASARCIPIYHYDGPITLTITRDGKDPNRWSWHI